MQPHLERQIEKMTREYFPNGIPGYGTDALRYTFYSLASTGRDIKFDIGRMEGFRNFCNKIWNASRYVLMNTEEQSVRFTAEERRALSDTALSLADRWILSLLQRTIARVHEHMAHYRFDLISQDIYEFFWNEYCDWYLELSKPVLWNAEEEPQRAHATRLTLLTVLEASLRMTHPLMPFITEEIWQRVAPLLGVEGETIMLQPYPASDSAWLDSSAEADIDWVKGVIEGIRNIRGEMDIAPGRRFPVLLRRGDDEDRRRLDAHRRFLMQLAKLAEIRWLEDDEEAPVCATQLHGELEILVPLADLIDKEAEIARLEKEIAKLEKNLQTIDGKLANSKFVNNAPEQVVANERHRKQENETQLSALREKLSSIRAL